VVAVVGIAGFFLLWVLMALPRGREQSRQTACQKHLMQIGHGLGFFHQNRQRYPTVPALGPEPGDSPIRILLDGLAIPDLLELRDSTHPPRPTGAPPRRTRIPGLACPSDPNAMAGRFPAAISYRANTGDTTSGEHGPFQPGRSLSSSEVEAADGLSFTAAFAERLVGDGVDGRSGPVNYATSPGVVGSEGCPEAGPDRWRGDAGSDWAEAGWRSTLYGHVLRPNGSPSCIAVDGRTAAIGASSAHPGRVNVLLLDGSLRGVTPQVDPKVWRSLGTVGPAETPGP
jgi:prepilin-type processing-associated H-X9-DG protein